MSTFRIGTYNVANLFDRFDDPYSTGDDMYGRYGTVPKSRKDLHDSGLRIRENGVLRQGGSRKPYPIDIVGLQEIESYGALRDFVQLCVGPEIGSQTGIVSLPSNDPRGIDLGLIVRTNMFRIGRVISHRFKKFVRSDGKSYQFGRDCLQVEILDEDTRELVLTVFNCHLKSKYTGKNMFNADGSENTEYKDAQEDNTIKRSAEVLEVVRIVKEAMDVETDRFVILGDFNDTPESEPLKPFFNGGDDGLVLHNATTLIEQADTSPTSEESRPRDTHHWKRPTSPTTSIDEWAQIDYLLCSDKLWEMKTEVAKVVNSPKGQGSDHYLSYVEFETP